MHDYDSLFGSDFEEEAEPEPLVRSPKTRRPPGTKRRLSTSASDNEAPAAKRPPFKGYPTLASSGDDMPVASSSAHPRRVVPPPSIRKLRPDKPRRTQPRAMPPQWSNKGTATEKYQQILDQFHLNLAEIRRLHNARCSMERKVRVVPPSKPSHD